MPEHEGQQEQEAVVKVRPFDTQLREACTTEGPLKGKLTVDAFESLQKQCQDPKIASMLMVGFFRGAEKLNGPQMDKVSQAISWGREAGISEETMRAEWMKTFDQAVQSV